MSASSSTSGEPRDHRWWVAITDPFGLPFDGPSQVEVGPVRRDRAELEDWAREATLRRPWLSHALRSLSIERLADGTSRILGGWPGVSLDDVELRCLAPLPHPAIDPRRRAWRWAPPTAGELYEVWIDAIDDDVVWRLEHEKGGDYEQRQPIADLLTYGLPPIGAPRSIEVSLVAAAKEHRRPDAASDLAIVAQRGTRDALRALLHSGAPVDQVGPGGRTPLGAAIAAGRDEIAVELLLGGASVESAVRYVLGRDGRSSVALELAVRAKCWSTALELLSRGASPSGERIPRPWEIALLSGAPDEVIDAMIARGAVLEAGSPVFRARRFHLLAWRRPALAARSPIPIPAAPAAKAPAPIDPARRAAHEARVLQERQALAMARAVAAGDLAAIDAGIAGAAQPLSDGQFLLHHASLAPASLQAEVVKRLIAGGASIDAVDRSGATALAKAVRRNAAPAVHALLAGGASPHGRDEGWSLVGHAVLADAAEVLEALLAAGARLTDVDARGRSAHELAAQKKHDACLRVLAKVADGR